MKPGTRGGSAKGWGWPYFTIILCLGLVAWHLYLSGPGGTPSVETLITAGARRSVFGFPQSPWRLFASTFLHAGWGHLLANLLMLGIWGSLFERHFGGPLMLLFVVVAGAWGGLASDLYGPQGLGVGASGAAYGLVTAILVLAVLRPKWPTWSERASTWAALSTLALVLNHLDLSGQFNLGMPGRVDVWAHYGGAALGFVVAVVAALLPARWLHRGLWALLLLLIGGLLALMEYRGPALFF